MNPDMMRWTDRTLLFSIRMMWGPSHSVIKIGTRELQPLMLRAVRFTLVALPAVFLLPRSTFRRPPVLAFGLLMGILQLVRFFIGMSLGISTGLASWMIQAQAFFTMDIAAALAGQSPRQIQKTGALVAAHGPF